MPDITVHLQLTANINKGDCLSLCVDSDNPLLGTVLMTTDVRPGLRVGDILSHEMGAFQVQSVGWEPCGVGVASRPVFLVKALHKMGPLAGPFTVSRTGYTLAWITMSDKGSQGKRVDESGPLVGELVGKTLELAFVQGFIIPDETDRLKGLLVDLALNQGFDFILTTGGTGVAPRDITPEATLAVIEKRLPGFERAMTAASLSKTPHGAISRAVAGTLAQTLIVNMPGSPKAVAECLDPLLPTLRHTLEKLQGDPSDCAALRKG